MLHIADYMIMICKLAFVCCRRRARNRLHDSRWRHWCTKWGNCGNWWGRQPAPPCLARVHKRKWQSNQRKGKKNWHCCIKMCFVLYCVVVLTTSDIWIRLCNYYISVGENLNWTFHNNVQGILFPTKAQFYWQHLKYLHKIKKKNTWVLFCFNYHWVFITA